MPGSGQGHGSSAYGLSPGLCQGYSQCYGQGQGQALWPVPQALGVSVPGGVRSLGYC